MFKKLYKYKLLIIVLGFTLFVLTFPIKNLKVLANNGIEISPASESENLKPGDKINKKFQVRNLDIITVNFDIKLGEFTPKGIIFNQTLESNPSINWLKLNTNSFTLKPGEFKDIDYIIDIPKNALNNIYTPIIGLFIKNSQDSGINGSRIDNYIIYKLQINVSTDNSNFNLVKISKYTIDNTILINNNTNLNFILENTNPKLSSKPLIYFHLIDPLSNILIQNIINEGGSDINLDEKFEKNLTIDLSKKPIGEYHAEILVIDTLTNKSSIAKLKFYYLPLQYIIIIFLILSFIILLLFRLRLTRRKSKILIK